MIEHRTLGDVLNAWSEILLLWGCRWLYQGLFLVGIGIGIGLGLTLAACWGWR